MASASDADALVLTNRLRQELSEMRHAAIFALGLSILLGPSLAASAPSSLSVRETTRQFLDAYAAGDEQTVLRLVAPDVVVYGGDVAEFAKGPEGVRHMMADDLRLWGAGAHIGEMSQVTISQDRRLAALTFQAPFELQGRKPVPVRFSMVWRRMKGGWRLAQSANATPSVGESAAELLKGAAR